MVKPDGPKVSITVSPMPPFLELKAEVSLERIVSRNLRPSAGATATAAAVKGVVELLLIDQYTDGDALGAWSRAYPAYLKHMFGDQIPPDVSVRDSITFSSWIARSLAAITADRDDEFARAIRPRITAYVRYLLRHQDLDSGGFGLSTRPTSRGSAGVAPDLRHTAWAMLSLARFAPDDEGAERLRLAASYVQRELEKHPRMRAITLSAVHCLLSTPEVGAIVIPSANARRAALKRLESRLVESFDPVYRSWDTTYDEPRLAAIDNAFFVLYALRISDCVDDECADTLRKAFDALRQMAKNGSIPIELEGAPNPGATAMLAFLLIRDMDDLTVRGREVDGLVRFAVEASATSHDFSYPWHAAQLLRIAAGDI